MNVMNTTEVANISEKASTDVEKRVRKIRKFYKQLISWVGTSIILIAIDLFLNQSITWSRYPVFFWGLSILIQYINIIRLQKLGREWEEKFVRKLAGESESEGAILLPPNDEKTEIDYSKELMWDSPEREKEPADLSEYRKLKRPWKDEDLV